jgi:hypothetical protein
MSGKDDRGISKFLCTLTEDVVGAVIEKTKCERKNMKNLRINHIQSKEWPNSV